MLGRKFDEWYILTGNCIHIHDGWLWQHVTVTSMSRQTNLSDDFQLLSDTLGGSQYNTQTKSATTSASSLLEAYRAAKSSTNPFKTFFPPIDHVIGPFMRPGNGIQISSPPGCYVEQLLLGLIRGTTSAGREVAVVGKRDLFVAQANQTQDHY